MQKHIAFISNTSSSLINFRGHLLKELLNLKFKIVVIAPNDDSFKTAKKYLKKIGIKLESYSLSRAGLNFFQDYRSYLAISSFLKKYRPNLVLAYGAKPVIYGGLAAHNLLPGASFFSLITGLGYGFTYEKSIKRWFVRNILIMMYRKSLKNAAGVIFQNPDDKKKFLNLKIIAKNKKAHVVNGSGVNLKEYPLCQLPKKPVFLMLARLVADKGVREYFEAARLVRQKFPDAIFRLAGKFDPNPSGIKSIELKSWIDSGHIQYLGNIKVPKKVLQACRFYVLPSYREGTPRSVLEALSTGRPVITTNVPGCRETVKNGKNGFLVPPRNSKLLARAMMRLLEETDKKIKNMAKKSYLYAKKKYDVRKVNKNMLDILTLKNN
jgi:glycosyltransferase involved in cell wall biosynthesis